MQYAINRQLLINYCTYLGMFDLTEESKGTSEQRKESAEGKQSFTICSAALGSVSALLTLLLLCSFTSLEGLACALRKYCSFSIVK